VLALNIAKELSKKFEGFKSKPYLCPAGVPTIGYGTTAYPNRQKVKLTDSSITKEQAIQYLEYELYKSLQGVLKYCPILIKEDKKLGAIIDFVYNLGVGRLQCSTLRRRINQQNWEEVKYELLKWIYANGRVLLGLVLRRKAEAGYI
jgi:lysozyme